MPWPDFSELSFGYAALSEFERLHIYGGRYPVAPTFISQREEAHQGHDVEVALSDGTPIFVQLKRSFVVDSTVAKEAGGRWVFPSYRMYLRKNRNFDQHKKLQTNERKGRNVLYLTSRVKDQCQLWTLYQSGKLLSEGSKALSPLAIPKPRDGKQHWVSFQASGSSVRRFSSEPVAVADKFESLPQHLEFLRSQSVDKAANLDALDEFVRDAQADAPWLAPLLDEVVGPNDLAMTFRRAALAAQATLDAKLLILPRKPLKPPGR